MKTLPESSTPIPEDTSERDIKELKKLIERKKLQNDGLKKIVEQINQSANQKPAS